MQQRVVRFKLIVPAKFVGTQPLNFRLGQQYCRNNQVVKLLVIRAKRKTASRWSFCFAQLTELMTVCRSRTGQMMRVASSGPPVRMAPAILTLCPARAILPQRFDNVCRLDLSEASYISRCGPLDSLWKRNEDRNDNSSGFAPYTFSPLPTIPVQFKS